MFWKSVPAFPRLVYVAGRLQLEEPGEQCGKHTPSAPEEVQQQHLSKFHVEFLICGCLWPKECGCFMPVGAFWRKVVSWILMAWRWERSAKRNWIRALWTWWLSSFLDCTSFGCFEYCGLCMVFVWDSRNNGVFVTLWSEDPDSRRGRHSGGVAELGSYIISNGAGYCRPLRRKHAEDHRFRWKFCQFLGPFQLIYLGHTVHSPGSPAITRVLWLCQEGRSEKDGGWKGAVGGPFTGWPICSNVVE